MWKWAKRITLTLFCAIVVGLIALMVTSRSLDPHPFTDTDEFLVIAHRGGKGLWPENTMHAFQRASEAGVDVLEMDLRSTRDGVLVVIHDQSVDRTTNGTGDVTSFSLAELQELDAGYWWSANEGQTYPYRDTGVVIPTFQSVLEAFPQTRLVVELKETGTELVRQVSELVGEHGDPSYVFMATFNGETTQQVRDYDPGIATGPYPFEAAMSVLFTKLYLGDLYHPAAHAFQVFPRIGSLEIVDERLLNVLHAQAVDVHVWTINDEAEMQRLIELGVDGIMTDYPGRLLRQIGRSPLKQVDDHEFGAER